MNIPYDFPWHQFIARIADTIYCPLPLTFWPLPVGLLFWVVFFWARSTEGKALSSRAPSHNAASRFDRGSWLLISQGLRLVRLAALVAALATPPSMDGAARYAAFGLGLALMIFGALLRQHCFRVLGEQFTYRVQVSTHGAIIKSGIYKWVRHPSYTGGMIYNIGMAFALTNWRSVAIVVVGILLMYVYRVYVEERALIAVHGDAYSDYMRNTKRFVPFVF